MEKKDSKYCGCLYYSANALARLMTRMADEVFATTGLSASYAFLLMTVNAKPGIQPLEISRQMMLTPSTISRLIEKMEHKGLLIRRINGRYTEVHPTEESLKLDQQIKTAWKDLKLRYSRVLGKAQAARITADIYDSVRKLDA
jgi:DNA-binding MarR family transcriptional regulator